MLHGDAFHSPCGSAKQAGGFSLVEPVVAEKLEEEGECLDEDWLVLHAHWTEIIGSKTNDLLVFVLINLSLKIIIMALAI